MGKLKTWAIGLGLMLIAGAVAPVAKADDYPARPIRVIVGFGPGAVADIIARVLATHMSQTLGQQLVVENRPGAGSSIGAEYVARAPKDGYTLFMCTVAQAINPAVSKLNFDFGKDMAPIMLVANVPQIIVAHPSLAANNVQELIALAKSKPDEIQYASSGVGTLSHLSGVLLDNMTGIKLMQVPYPGSAQGMTDVLAGRVPLMFGPASTVMPNVRAGKLRRWPSPRPSVRPSRPTCRPWRKQVFRIIPRESGWGFSRRPAHLATSSPSCRGPPTKRCNRRKFWRHCRVRASSRWVGHRRCSHSLSTKNSRSGMGSLKQPA